MVSPLGIVADTPAHVQGRVRMFKFAVVTNGVCASETREVKTTERRNSNFFILQLIFMMYTAKLLLNYQSNLIPEILQ